jgi:hypothetical protein
MTAVRASAGRPLAPSVRSAVEPRFGHDFGRVRIHDDPVAARSASALGARAYTVGNDIAFAAGQYRESGDALLAHELAHVVQQDGAGAMTEERVSDLDDASERAADAAVHAAAAGGAASRQIAQQLRAAAPAAPAIQCGVKTWGGEFLTEKFERMNDRYNDGVNIVLHFKPNLRVDALKIGMLQTSQSRRDGQRVFPAGTQAEQETRRSRTVPEGRPGAGTAIDQSPENPNPLYAATAEESGGALRSAPTDPGMGQHGFHYFDETATVHEQDAILRDGPFLPSSSTRASQHFETAALAIEGKQKNTFYGSVSWGWAKNELQGVTTFPPSLSSKTIPTLPFRAAAQAWTGSKTSKGEETIGLPRVRRARVRDPGPAPVVMQPGDPAGIEVASLTSGTQVEVTNRGKGKSFNEGAAVSWWKVTVVSGPDAGAVGWMREDTITQVE